MQRFDIVFVAQAYDIFLTSMYYITIIVITILASIGTTDVVGIDRIPDITKTTVNITDDTVCTTIVAKQNNAVNKDIYYQQKTSHI